jgi:hypothetical protein
VRALKPELSGEIENPGILFIIEGDEKGSTFGQVGRVAFECH